MSYTYYQNIVEKYNDDHIYYNIDIRPYENSALGAKVASFVDNRSDPIIGKPKDYHLSVIRASITALSIPIFIFKTIRNPITGNYSPNNAFYGFTLRDTATGTNFQRFIQFVPQYIYFSSNVIQHYYIFSFQHFINMMNSAIALAFTDLKTAIPANPCTQPPYFIYNNTDETIDFICQKQFIGNIRFFWNQESFRFFENYNVTYLGFNQVAGCDIEMVIQNNKNNCHCECPIYLTIGTTNGVATITSAGLFSSALDGSIVSGPGIPSNAIATFNNVNQMTLSMNATATATITAKFENCNLLKIIPDYQTTYLWSDVKSIILTSSLLPVKEEFTPSLNEASEDSSQRILTDFEPPFSIGEQIRGYYQYVPTAEYRRIDLKGINALSNFDLNVFWKSKTGEIYPIYLIPGSSPISVKVLFERKLKKSLE